MRNAYANSNSHRYGNTNWHADSNTHRYGNGKWDTDCDAETAEAHANA